MPKAPTMVRTMRKLIALWEIGNDDYLKVLNFCCWDWFPCFCVFVWREEKEISLASTNIFLFLLCNRKSTKKAQGTHWLFVQYQIGGLAFSQKLQLGKWMKMGERPEGGWRQVALNAFFWGKQPSSTSVAWDLHGFTSWQNQNCIFLLQAHLSSDKCLKTFETSSVETGASTNKKTHSNGPMFKMRLHEERT